MQVAWYRQFWPWLLIAIPLSAVGFGVLMILVASHYPDDLVVDDYYRQGLAINEQLNRKRSAGRLGIGVSLIDWRGDELTFRFNNANDSAVVLNMYHVVDSEKDRRIMLYPDPAPGLYSARAPAAAEALRKPGIWYLEFEGVDEAWSLQTRVETPLSVLEVGSR